MIKYTLPKLQYNYQSLEPYIDAKTMEIHHTKHHQGYINKLNAELQTLPTITHTTLEDLCKNIQQYTTSIRNNAGGTLNHNLFFNILHPNPQKTPSQKLSQAIIKKFGNLNNCINQINQTGLKHFGSGWVWLIIHPSSQQLYITTTNNQDNPLMPINTTQGIPILGIDLWEHAYYLKHQNKRADYLQAIWDVINWEAISENYIQAIN